MGKGAFPAVLHCFTGGRDLACKAIALGPVRLVHRHPDVQEIRRSARHRRGVAGRPHSGRDRRAVSGAACHIAASATSRPMWSKPPRCWRRPAACRSTRSRGRPRRTSSACSPRCRGTLADMPHEPHLHHSRLRLVLRRAAAALGWGACDPNNPKNRRRRCSLLVERTAPSGSHARADRHLARSARAVARRAESTGSTPCCSPTSTPTIPTASTICARCSCKQRRRIDVYLDEPTSEVMRARFGYCFASAARQRLSADPQRAPAGARQAGHHRRAGRSDRGAAGAAGARRHRLARLPLRQRRLFRRHQRRCRRRACALLAGLDLWIVDALRYAAASEPFQRSTRRWTGSAASSRSGAILTNLHADLDYEVLRGKAAGRMSSRPMTGCGLKR